MATKGVDNAILCLVCDADGIVRFESAVARRPVATPAQAADRADGRDAPADDGWTSAAPADGDTAAAADGVVIGAPLVKTYWFDHHDCDARDLAQTLRRCARDGVADRARLWLRLDAEQLTRAELTFTPLAADAERSGRLVLVRAEPTPASAPGAGRRAQQGQPETKPIGRAGATAAAATVDLLELRLPTPMLRLDRARGTILAANTALADLVGRPDRASCANLPLTELVDPRDRRAIAELLAAARAANGAADRVVEVRLLLPDARDVTARLSVVADADAIAGADVDRVLIVARDVTSDAQVAQLMSRADQLADVAVRNGAMLRTLERAFERAPVGFALTARGERFRANPAYESAAARAPDVAAAADDTAGRARRDRAEAAHDAPLAHVRSFWVGDEQHDVVGTLIWPRDAAGPAVDRRLRALARATDDDARVTVAWLVRDGGGVRLVPIEGEISPAATLNPSSIEAIVGALDVAQNNGARHALPVLLADGRAAEATLAPLAGNDGIVAIVCVAVPRPSPDQLDRARDELGLAPRAIARTRRGGPRAPRRARRGRPRCRAARDPRRRRTGRAARRLAGGGRRRHVRLGRHRRRVDADARARTLLACGDGALAQATLLGAADVDDRKAYERALFDGLNDEGSDEIDVVVRIGPDARPVRIVGRVLFDGADAARDPTRFVAAVVDLAEAAAQRARVSAFDVERNALSARVVTLESRAATLAEDLAARVAAVEAAERAAAEAGEERETLRAAIASREASLAAAIAAREAVARDAEAAAGDRADLLARAAELERERDAARAAIDEHLAGTTRERDALQARLSAVESDRAAAVDSLARAEAKLKSADADRAGLEKRIAKLDRERIAAEGALKRSEAARVAAADGLARAEVQAAAASSRVANLARDLAARDATIADAASNANDAARDRDAARVELDAMRAGAKESADALQAASAAAEKIAGDARGG